MKIFQKKKIPQTEQREFYLFGIKFFHYKKKIRKRGVISPTAIFKTKGNLIIDPTAEIKEGVILQNGRNNTIHIGQSVQLNPYVVLYGGNITIKDNCMIAPHVVITTANHDFVQTAVPMRLASAINEADLTIEEDVWIGANSTIIAGTKTIGKGAVIGANSVVNKPVPPYAVVAGVPAKIIKYRKQVSNQKKVH